MLIWNVANNVKYDPFRSPINRYLHVDAGRCSDTSTKAIVTKNRYGKTFQLTEMKIKTRLCTTRKHLKILLRCIMASLSSTSVIISGVIIDYRVMDPHHTNPANDNEKTQ